VLALTLLGFTFAGCIALEIVIMVARERAQRHADEVAQRARQRVIRIGPPPRHWAGVVSLLGVAALFRRRSTGEPMLLH
jgi:hypothetical protein